MSKPIHGKEGMIVHTNPLHPKNKKNSGEEKVADVSQEVIAHPTPTSKEPKSRKKLFHKAPLPPEEKTENPLLGFMNKNMAKSAERVALLSSPKTPKEEGSTSQPSPPKLTRSAGPTSPEHQGHLPILGEKLPAMETGALLSTQKTPKEEGSTSQPTPPKLMKSAGPASPEHKDQLVALGGRKLFSRAELLKIRKVQQQKKDGSSGSLSVSSRDLKAMRAEKEKEEAQIKLELEKKRRLESEEKNKESRGEKEVEIPSVEKEKELEKPTAEKKRPTRTRSFTGGSKIASHAEKKEDAAAHSPSHNPIVDEQTWKRQARLHLEIYAKRVINGKKTVEASEIVDTFIKERGLRSTNIHASLKNARQDQDFAVLKPFLEIHDPETFLQKANELKADVSKKNDYRTLLVLIGGQEALDCLEYFAQARQEFIELVEGVILIKAAPYHFKSRAHKFDVDFDHQFPISMIGTRNTFESFRAFTRVNGEYLLKHAIGGHDLGEKEFEDKIHAFFEEYNGTNLEEKTRTFLEGYVKFLKKHFKINGHGSAPEISEEEIQALIKESTLLFLKVCKEYVQEHLSSEERKESRVIIEAILTFLGIKEETLNEYLSGLEALEEKQPKEGNNGNTLLPEIQFMSWLIPTLNSELGSPGGDGLAQARLLEDDRVFAKKDKAIIAEKFVELCKKHGKNKRGVKRILKKMGRFLKEKGFSTSLCNNFQAWGEKYLLKKLKDKDDSSATIFEHFARFHVLQVCAETIRCYRVLQAASNGAFSTPDTYLRGTFCPDLMHNDIAKPRATASPTIPVRLEFDIDPETGKFSVTQIKTYTILKGRQTNNAKTGETIYPELYGLFEIHFTIAGNANSSTYTATLKCDNLQIADDKPLEERVLIARSLLGVAGSPKGKEKTSQGK